MSAFEDNPFADEEDEDFTLSNEFSNKMPVASVSFGVKRPRDDDVTDRVAPETLLGTAVQEPDEEVGGNLDHLAAAGVQTTAALLAEYDAAREAEERSALAARVAGLEEELQRKDTARAAELARVAKDNDELRASVSLLRETINRVSQEMDVAPPPPAATADVVPAPWRPSDAQLREATSLRERLSRRCAAATPAPAPCSAPPHNAREALHCVDAATADALSAVPGAGPLLRALLNEWRRRTTRCAQAQSAGRRALRRAAASASLLREWAAAKRPPAGPAEERPLVEPDARESECCAQRAQRMVGALLLVSSESLRSAAALHEAAPRISAALLSARADRLGRAVLRLRRGDPPRPASRGGGSDALAQLAAELSARVGAAEGIVARVAPQQSLRAAGSPGAAVTAAALDALAAVQDALLRDLRALNAALQERALCRGDGSAPLSADVGAGGGGVCAADESAVAGLRALAAESLRGAAAASAAALGGSAALDALFAAGLPPVAPPAECRPGEAPGEADGGPPEAVAGAGGAEEDAEAERGFQEETAALRRRAEEVSACLRWLEAHPTHRPVSQLLAARKETEALRERLKAGKCVEAEYQQQCAEVSEARNELEEAEAELEAMRARMSELNEVDQVANAPPSTECEE